MNFKSIILLILCVVLSFTLISCGTTDDPNNETPSTETNTPSNPTPSNPTPSEPTPSNPTPSEPTPSNPTPSEPNPSNPTPSEPTPSNPTPSEPTPSNPTPSEPTPSEPTPSEPTPSNPTPSEPTPGEPNQKVDIVALLRTLLNDYELNPYSYIPESMRPDYASNLVNPNSLISDYSSSVNVSSIKSGGHGEQWHMILDNINESMVFFNLLSAVEAVSATSISVFNNYIDQNPADTAQYIFKESIYNVTIKFDGEIIFYVLDYTANVPLLGNQTVQIALAMDVETGVKTVRTQIGDANALTYIKTESSYQFAIKYAGVRRAYFSIAKTGNNQYEGHIYEHLTASGATLSSSADFYIADDYVTAVGNKANGLLGFTGYIVELYDANTGKLLGYEVKETLSALTYDTLWFDLNKMSGISSIRYTEKTDTASAAFYLNGSSTAFKPKKPLVGSRHFDIEFRTQYFYSYDATSGEYVCHAVQVPMLFVQEKYYDDLTKELKAENGITVTSTVSATHFNKLTSSYEALIPTFINNKDIYTADNIVAFIGEKIKFE